MSEEFEPKPKILQKVSWNVVMVAIAPVVFYIMRHFGLIEVIPVGYELGLLTLTLVNVVLKTATWLYYRLKKKSLITTK